KPHHHWQTSGRPLQRNEQKTRAVTAPASSPPDASRSGIVGKGGRDFFPCPSGSRQYVGVRTSLPFSTQEGFHAAVATCTGRRAAPRDAPRPGIEAGAEEARRQGKVGQTGAH